MTVSRNPIRFFRQTGPWLMALLLLAACGKDEMPDPTYNVTYTVTATGNVNIQQIRYTDFLGFERVATPEPSFVRTFRIPPGTAARIQAVGVILDGTVRVQVEAANPENTLSDDDTVTFSGTTPQSFDLVAEVELR